MARMSPLGSRAAVTEEMSAAAAATFMSERSEWKGCRVSVPLPRVGKLGQNFRLW